MSHQTIRDGGVAPRLNLKSTLRIVIFAGVMVTMTTQLTGCFLLAAGAVVGGSYAATDRRSLGTQTDDKVIAVKVDHQISDDLGDVAHVNVNTFNRKVLLTGEVPNAAAKARAGAIAHAVEGVTDVVNELTIAPPSALVSRSNDALITTQVKAQLVNEKDVFANAFKVATERGIVYLMGRVTRREGDYAANIARGVSGVQAVVKVYDYISEDQLKDMDTQAAPS